MGVRTYALSTAEGRAQGLATGGWPSLDEVLEVQTRLLARAFDPSSPRVFARPARAD